MRKDIYSAFGDFMIYGLGAVAMQAVSILLIPVYTRWLGVADYGVLSLLMGIQFMLVPLAQAGMGSALFRSYYDYNDEAGHRGVAGRTGGISPPRRGSTFRGKPPHQECGNPGA